MLWEDVKTFFDDRYSLIIQSQQLADELITGVTFGPVPSSLRMCVCS